MSLYHLIFLWVTYPVIHFCILCIIRNIVILYIMKHCNNLAKKYRGLGARADIIYVHYQLFTY